jgi:hypothetical protein
VPCYPGVVLSVQDVLYPSIALAKTVGQVCARYVQASGTNLRAPGLVTNAQYMFVVGLVLCVYVA